MASSRMTLIHGFNSSYDTTEHFGPRLHRGNLARQARFSDLVKLTTRLHRVGFPKHH